jgi:hypothetical protein
MALRCLLLSVAVVFSSLTAAQDLPRTATGQPDLGGIWRVQNRAAVDLLAHAAAFERPAGMSVVAGGELPYQPWARAQQQQNFATRAQTDPFAHCYLPGVPRIMTLEFPFQIFQTAENVAMTFEWQQVFRLIHTNDTASLYEGIESWMGHSRGAWEGDELVVTVKDFNERSWLDGSGNFHSAAMVLTERFRMLDADTIAYTVTVDDPEVYTQPWTMSMNLYRQQELDRVLEYQCQAEKEEANGAFEPDVRNWYPAGIPGENVAFDATATSGLPLPQASAEIARLPDGTPDIGGYYMADAGGANYGLEKSAGGALMPPARGVVVDPADGVLPYQGWARAERNDRILPHRGYDDPTAHCFVAGIPRSHYVPSPFQIVQTPDHVVQLFERMSWRQIDLQRKEHLPEHMRLWQGDALGHWEGDTLVVDSRNYNGKAWLNEAGDVISHMATVRETYTPVSRDRLIYRATVTDPIAYTRPWTIEVPLDRLQDELLEVACLEDNNDLQHLRDVRDEFRAAQPTTAE